jgi:transcriptional regulator with XRE-family HTH domain
VLSRRPKRRPEAFLKFWREKRGLSQAEVARRVGTSPDQVSRWESGHRGISLTVFRQIAAALGVDPADLFRHPDRPSLDKLARNLPEQDLHKLARVIEDMGKH